MKYFANRMTKSGIPDLICCVNGFSLWIEVKGQSGRASELQSYNVKKIRQSGGFAFIVYPSGWLTLKHFIDELHLGKISDDLPEILK